MQFPASIALFGAAAIVGVAIFVCGRVLRSAILEMGNPALDKQARVYVGRFALLGVLIILCTSLAAARLANDDDARHSHPPGSSEPAPQPPSDAGIDPLSSAG